MRRQAACKLLVVVLLTCTLAGCNAADRTSAPNDATPRPMFSRGNPLARYSGASASVFVRVRGPMGLSDQQRRVHDASTLGGVSIADDPRDSTLGMVIPASETSIVVTALRAMSWVADVRIDPTTVYPQSEVTPWGVHYTGADYLQLQYGILGSGVKVAILDDGLDCTHPDLAANFAGGYDFVHMTPECAYAPGPHGTAVAGIIAAAANGSGVVGMAPSARIYMLRICASDGCPTFREKLAIEWAIANGMQVINLSLANCGDHVPDTALANRVASAYSAGILIVGSAGHGIYTEPDPCAPGSPVGYPAAYDQVIAVSALRQDETYPPGYQYGPKVEISAPTDVMTDAVGGGLRTFGGTSAATPHVTGAIAEAIANGTPSVRYRLQTEAKDLGAVGRDIYYGFGALRADRTAIREPNVASITGQNVVKTAGTYTYQASIAYGDAPILLDWVVDYTLNGVPTHYESGYQSSGSLRYSWPAGNYLAVITATPKEQSWGRIGSASAYPVNVCTGGASLLRPNVVFGCNSPPQLAGMNGR